MSERVEKSGLQVDAALADFVEREVLAPLGRDVGAFWSGFAALLIRFAPVNRALLAKRDELQAQIDAWHTGARRKAARPGRVSGVPARDRLPRRRARAVRDRHPERRPRDLPARRAATGGPGAQRAVPAQRRQRALGQPLRRLLRHRCLAQRPAARPGGYDPVRGDAVIKAGRAFLDLSVPLEDMSWADWDGEAVPPLCEPEQFLGRRRAGCCSPSTDCTSSWCSTATIRSARPTARGSPTSCSKPR